MYIVTRTFRDANGVFKVGSVVEPTAVKAFKSRLQQRHIINVDEQNIEKWSQYFINRHGIDLTEVLTNVASSEGGLTSQNDSNAVDDKGQAASTITEESEAKPVDGEVDAKVHYEDESHTDAIDSSDDPQPEAETSDTTQAW